MHVPVGVFQADCWDILMGVKVYDVLKSEPPVLQGNVSYWKTQ